MVQSLTFIDCSNCGKRIRSNARECHHCHQSNLSAQTLSHPTDSESWRGSENSKRESFKSSSDSSSDFHPEGSAFGDDQDDFDYQEYLAEEFPEHANRKPRVKRWVWITAWVLIFTTLLPYLYYVLILAK